MPVTRQILQMELGYSAWATRQLLNPCQTLSAAELTRDLGASHRSIHETLLHIFYAERVWVQRLASHSLPPMIEVGDQSIFQHPILEPSLQALRLAWSKVWSDSLQWLENLPDEDLTRRLTTSYPDGRLFHISPWEIVLHSVNHSTLHRGQIVGMLRLLGRQPPNTDIFSYFMLQQSDYFDRGPASQEDISGKPS